MKLTEILARFDDVSEESDGGYLARCPAHGDNKPSLRIWLGDNGKLRLTCRAGCGSGSVVTAAGLVWKNLFNVEADGATVPAEAPKPVPMALTVQLAGYVDAATRNLMSGSPMAVAAVEYAVSRFGVDPDQFEVLGLGLDDGETGSEFPYRSSSFREYPRLTVPLFDFDGRTAGLQGRDITGECPGRWLSLSNPRTYRWSPYGVFETGSDTIVVTEGPGDGLTVAGAGFDALVIRGAALANNADLSAEVAAGLGRYKRVVVAGDNDAAGRQFTERLVSTLSTRGVEATPLSAPVDGWDLTDWRADNPDEFRDALHKEILNSRPARKEVTRVTEVRKSDEQPTRTGVMSVTEEDGRHAAAVINRMVDTYGDSDAANAHALVEWTGNTIKWSKGLGFYVWNGRVWEPSDAKVRQAVHRMGAALVLAGKVREAKGFTLTSRIDDLISEIKSVPAVLVDPDEFDSKPDLLSFRNGVVDLRNGALRPHMPDDMLTYSLDIDYDPNAECPRWESFLSEIFPEDPELVPYMQRLTGYGITGHTSEQCFTVLWGKGANGKSVLTDVLSTIFRQVTTTTPFATFEDKGSGGIPNDLAALRGARLVMASEGDSGKPMSEAVLKRITGKDKVTARFLRQEFFTFSPTFLIMLATNHKPKFKGQDEGLWRRVKLIPFKRWFAPNERDYDLDRKLLAEAPGIVAWVVRGAMEWYRKGLGDPDVITKATREYRETSDALAGFFPGVLVEDADGRLLGADAYNAYKDWCEAEGLPQKERWRRTTFYNALEERGIHRTKMAKGITLMGVRLADIEEPDLPDSGIGIP